MKKKPKPEEFVRHGRVSQIEILHDILGPIARITIALHGDRDVVIVTMPRNAAQVMPNMGQKMAITFTPE